MATSELWSIFNLIKMQKKGVVYRATMAAGLLFIAGQTVGEVGYWRLMRKDRDEVIASDKEDEKKMIRFMTLTEEEQEAETKDDLTKSVEAAKQRKSWFQSREDFKQERLAKIMKRKESEKQLNIMSDAPTMEEMKESGNSYQAVKQRKLVEKDSNIAEDKNGYI